MRTFIALKFPPKVLMQIKEIQDVLPECSCKKTELKNLHLTLKFLGEVPSDKLEDIKLRLRNVKFSQFESEIKEIGFFDKQERGILWLGITNCENIQKEIDKSLEGLYEKENRFMGHLTIARTGKILSKKLIEETNKINIPKMFFILDKFYLMCSKLKKDGPTYTVLEEYNLN
jgi:RNA 2',3'-cyclic 3'-phosphodiesterase